MIPEIHITLFFLLALSSTACPTTYEFSYSSCTFYMTYTEPDTCSAFDFHECQWQQCVAYYYDDDGYSYCIQTEYFGHSNWDYCTAQCCDSSVSYSQDSQGLQQCQDYLHGQFIKTLIIVGSVIGGVAVIVGLGVLICCCRSRGCGRICEGFCECLKAVFCCSCLRRARRRQQSQIEVKQNLQIEMTPPTVLKTPMIDKKGWFYEGTQNSKLKNYCSICLEDKPSIMLQCTHSYHKKCIIACMEKKKQCALCRSTEFNKIKIYCEQCFTAYLESTLLQNMDQIGKENFMCDGCKEANIYN